MIIIDKIDKDNDIKAIVFDIDGTVTRWKNVESFLQKALKNLGINYQTDYLNGLYKAMEMREFFALTTGESDENSYASLLEIYLPDLKKYNISGRNLKDIMFELEPDETFITSEVPYELEILSKKYSLYAYSNWFQQQTIKKLKKHSLLGYFKEVYSSNNNYIKFTRIGFEVIRRRHNLSSKEIIYIGDSPSDILSDCRPNRNSIYINYNFKSMNDISQIEQKMIEQATASVTEFRDIRKVLIKKDNS